MYKLGFQTPRGGKRNKHFNGICIKSTYNDKLFSDEFYPQYCTSHNFFYNGTEEKCKLYQGKACIYTDDRYYDDGNNFFYETYLYNERFYPISLKSCIRRINKSYNIPVGTIIKLETSWHYDNKRSNPEYYFKVKKENKKEFSFEVTRPAYLADPKDSYLKTLCSLLRDNGFLVGVYNNYGDEYLQCYGHDKIVGISPIGKDYYGYVKGIDNILFDYFGEFDKWSRCVGLPKSTDINEIISILTDKNE